jgi:Flp pilus assembly pilin Flp
MKPHRGSVQRFRRNQRGVAAIELALVTPILALSALCVGDLGRFALQKTWVTYAASAGAEYAVAHGFNATKIATAATSAVPVSGISISPKPERVLWLRRRDGGQSLDTRSNLSVEYVDRRHGWQICVGDGHDAVFPNVRRRGHFVSVDAHCDRGGAHPMIARRLIPAPAD